MLYAVQCTDAKGVESIRNQYLTPHKDYLISQAHILVVGGALLAEGTEELLGSLYIVNVANREAAEAFSGGDPFTQAGVFATVTITAMRKSHWNPASA
jgi:uncharacterized protein YciI